MTPEPISRPSPDARPDVTEMELGELEAALHDQGCRPYHARQVYRWIHRRGINDFARMTDLSLDLRRRLSRAWRVTNLRVEARARSVDGTIKLVLGLTDSRRIEVVFIPDGFAPVDETPWSAASEPGSSPASLARGTFCISTQVGCAMGCKFCLTGRMGFVRHLTAGEIAAQVRLLAGEAGVGDRFNIVLMGMGEPLHNYTNTMKAFRMLTDTHGLAVAPRRITLSTVGVVPALDRLANEPAMPNVAVSLHATTEEQRSLIVPPNRKYRLTDILAACRRFPLRRRNRITFEYVLLDGFNDSADDARRLARLVSDIRCKVNLIPLNEAAGIPFARPPDERVSQFARILAAHRVTVSVRKSRGRDIRAACGQLIVEGGRPAPAQRLAAEL